MGLFGFGKKKDQQEEPKTKEVQEEPIKQNLEEKGEFQSLLTIQLLFREKGIRPSVEQIKAALTEAMGEVEVVADLDHSLSSFAVKRYPVEYDNGQSVPAQVLMADFNPFDSGKVDAIQRSQLWDCQDGEALLDSCAYQVMLSDFMAAGLDYKDRCTMLADWLEVALKLFPDCEAVWVPSSGKLLTRQQALEFDGGKENRFIYYAVNARFFRIQDTEDMVVDTLGLYSIGLPDVQYHFHDLDPNAVVNHAYNAASYLYDKNAPIENGETIDGLSPQGIDREVQWVCQYEDALIQPARVVMDICAGEYAAGGRG